MKNTNKMNKYGVKVGDVFVATWGYDQTNNNFFQVTELVGSASVRVVEVAPQYETTWTGFMAENRKIQKFDGQPLQKVDRSLDINDQVKGDLHRICQYGDSISIKFHSYMRAYKTLGGNTIYESWYA